MLVVVLLTLNVFQMRSSKGRSLFRNVSNVGIKQNVMFLGLHCWCSHCVWLCCCWLFLKFSLLCFQFSVPFSFGKIERKRDRINDVELSREREIERLRWLEIER